MKRAITQAACVLLLLGGGVAPASGAQAQPQPQGTPAAAAAKPGDWPAFHGGGALTGEAPGGGGGLPAGGPAAMRERWTYVTNDEDPSPIVGSPAIAGDAVYVGDADGTLHAVDLKTGQGRWKYEADNGFETTPLVVDSAQVGGPVVLIGDMGGVFHAVDARKGTKLWAVETLTSIHSSANAIGEHVVFGNDGAEIYCLNAADGKEVWKKAAGDRVNSAPAIGFGAALVSGCDGKLRAIDLKTGDEKYAADLGAVSAASPAVLADRLVTGTDQGRIVCLSPEGKQLWVYDQVDGGQMVYASPAVSGGIAVAGARDRQVHAVDVNTGKRAWTFRTKGDVDSSPAIANGRVYVGSKDKRFYVLDLKSGKSLWEFNAGKGIVSSPAIGGGAVVFGDNGGTLYCLEPEGK